MSNVLLIEFEKQYLKSQQELFIGYYFNAYLNITFENNLMKSLILILKHTYMSQVIGKLIYIVLRSSGFV